ncbi:MAG: STAS domain-containing protein [Nannocystaceae bacterium]|nr:STAS domain-containing protein [Myxococcales bacterium]
MPAPPDSRALLDAALERLAAGDVAGVRAALGALAEQLVELTERAEHAEEVIERLPVGFFRNALADGTILYANQANAALLGYADADEARRLLVRSADAYVHPEEREVLKQALVTTGKIDGFRTAVRRKDGSIGHVELSARIYPKEGAVEGVMIDDAPQRAREEELQAIGDALRERNALLEEKQATIDALSLPIIEVWEQALCVPLIGALDRGRTQRLMAGVLEEVARRQASALFVDMTGIDAVESSTAHHLLGLARAVELLGARVVLCGIRPEVAHTFASLGLELRGVEVRATLKEALAALLHRRAR